MKNFVRKALPFLALFIFISCTSNVASKGSITIKFGSAREAVDYSDLTVSLVLTYPDGTKSDPVILKDGSKKTFNDLDEGTYSIYANAYKVDAENPEAEPEICYEYKGEPFFLEAGETHAEPVLLKAVPKKSSEGEDPVVEPVDDTDDDEPAEETPAGNGSGSAGTSKPEEEKKTENSYLSEDKDVAVSGVCYKDEGYELKFVSVQKAYESKARYRADIDISTMLENKKYTISQGDTVVLKIKGVPNANLNTLLYQFAGYNSEGELDYYNDSRCSYISIEDVIVKDKEFEMILPINFVTKDTNDSYTIFELVYDTSTLNAPLTISKFELSFAVYPASLKTIVLTKGSYQGRYRDELTYDLNDYTSSISGGVMKVEVNGTPNTNLLFNSINLMTRLEYGPYGGLEEGKTVSFNTTDEKINFDLNVFNSYNAENGNKFAIQFVAEDADLTKPVIIKNFSLTYGVYY